MRTFVHHKNIAALLGVCVNTVLNYLDNTSELARLGIMMEFAIVDTLTKYLSNHKVRQKKTQSMNNIKSIFKNK